MVLYHLFQSAHPVKGAIITMILAESDEGVSIRAPREGCDIAECRPLCACLGFNPRTP